jgi:predicted amidophosphoribosyltransferase
VIRFADFSIKIRILWKNNFHCNSFVILKQFFLNPVCIKCGSLFVEQHLYCDVCFKIALAPELERNRLRENHIFLFEWAGGEALDQLVYRLKADRALPALSFYSKILAYKISEEFSGSRFDAVVPIPSANPKSILAHKIGEILAASLKIPFVDLLVKNKSGAEQKSLKAVERARLNPFELRLEEGKNEDITEFNPHQAQPPKRYLFVDDVLTTGNSFKHASEAVYWSKRNVIATLFYRPSFKSP